MNILFFILDILSSQDIFKGCLLWCWWCHYFGLKSSICIYLSFPFLNSKKCLLLTICVQFIISLCVKTGKGGGALSDSGCRHWPLTPAPAPPPGPHPCVDCQNQNEFAECFLGEMWAEVGCGVGIAGGRLIYLVENQSLKCRALISINNLFKTFHFQQLYFDKTCVCARKAIRTIN